MFDIIAIYGKRLAIEMRALRVISVLCETVSDVVFTWRQVEKAWKESSRKLSEVFTFIAHIKRH